MGNANACSFYDFEAYAEYVRHANAAGYTEYAECVTDHDMVELDSQNWA